MAGTQAIFQDGLFSVPASLGDHTVVQRGFFTPWAGTMAAFDLQGHRGARGLRPENTLPSFEIAFDVGVSSVETDLQLTSDDAGRTTISGPVADQAALHGLLTRIRDLGLTLLEVRCTDQ